MVQKIPERQIVTCSGCGEETEPAIKCPNNLAAVFAMAGMRGKHVKGQKDGHLCPSCGKFDENNPED